jgi:hypothetical protein
MRLLLLPLVFCTALNAAGLSPREAQLAALKEVFPAHTAGELTPKSNPTILDCYTKIEHATEKISINSLAKDVVELRGLVESEISENRKRLAQVDPKELRKEPPWVKRPFEQNLDWLINKVRPYVEKFESLQATRD